jgi:hypothetical protein
MNAMAEVSTTKGLTPLNNLTNSSVSCRGERNSKEGVGNWFFFYPIHPLVYQSHQQSVRWASQALTYCAKVASDDSSQFSEPWQYRPPIWMSSEFSINDRASGHRIIGGKLQRMRVNDQGRTCDFCYHGCHCVHHLRSEVWSHAWETSKMYKGRGSSNRFHLWIKNVKVGKMPDNEIKSMWTQRRKGISSLLNC